MLFDSSFDWNKLVRKVFDLLELHNRVEAQDDAIGGISSRAEDQVGVLEGITESTDQISGSRQEYRML
jgi:hypothetical protein